MEGWLSKEGLVAKRFKRRYMRLAGDRIAYSAEAAAGARVRGSIDLRGAVCSARSELGDEAAAAAASWGALPEAACFVVVTPARTYYLAADSPELAR